MWVRVRIRVTVMQLESAASERCAGVDGLCPALAPGRGVSGEPRSTSWSRLSFISPSGARMLIVRVKIVWLKPGPDAAPLVG